MILLIKENGVVHVVDGVEGEPTLKQLYLLIDTDMIEVPGSGFEVNGEQIQFVVDEEGKIKDRPVNVAANMMYQSVLLAAGFDTGFDVLVGNVVILTGKHLMT